MNPIREAIDVLDEFGWSKAGSMVLNGKKCMVTALFEVGLKREHLIPALTILTDVIAEQFPERWKGGHLGPAIGKFNDDPDTTRSDVDRAMDKAAVRWDEIYGDIE